MLENLFISIPIDYLETEKNLLEKYRFNLELKIFSHHLDDLNLKSFIEMSKFIDNLGVRITFHAPFVDLSPGGFDEKIRQITEDRFMMLLDIAAIFTPENIVFHPGFNEIIHGQFFKLWKERCKITWEKIIKYAIQLNQKISFENIFEKDTRVLEALLKIAKYKNAGICLDAGHHNVFSEIPIIKYFYKFKNKIFELHLHDNDGTFDWHKAVGEGNIDFENIINLAKEFCPEAILTLEPHDKETLFKSYENIIKLLNE